MATRAVEPPLVKTKPIKTTRQASPRSPQPKPHLVDIALVVVGLGLGATVGIALTAETHGQFAAPGGVAMFLGNITGLVGTYLALVMVLLVSRIPWVERVLGQDGLLAWHRKVAPWPISLIIAHAILLTFGYAEAAKTGVLHELGTFISSFPDMLTATVALCLMIIIGIASIRAIRTRLRRETWWALHLFIYLSLALAFAHEVVLGPSFVGHPLTQLVWSIAWASTAGFVITYRFGMPILRSLRHRLVVSEVRREAPDVVSIILKGKNLERLAVSGGQFFEWRFLSRNLWWQAHPFSISARPRPPFMRLTVKAVGDFTSALATIPVGTKVAIEGPYGAFTSHVQNRRKVILFAGGIGVTAIRSLLEDLPIGCDPIVVLRSSSNDTSALVGEVTDLVERHKGHLREMVGSRDKFSFDQIIGTASELRNRDAYVVGSVGFVEGIVDALRKRGLSNDAIHAEIFAI